MSLKHSLFVCFVFAFIQSQATDNVIHTLLTMQSKEFIFTESRNHSDWCRTSNKWMEYWQNYNIQSAFCLTDSLVFVYIHSGFWMWWDVQQKRICRPVLKIKNEAPAWIRSKQDEVTVSGRQQGERQEAMLKQTDVT